MRVIEDRLEQNKSQNQHTTTKFDSLEILTQQSMTGDGVGAREMTGDGVRARENPENV